MKSSEAKPRSEKLPKPCAKCETLHTGKTCPKCGNERTRRLLRKLKGELVQISGKKKKYNKPEKQAFWSMALVACPQTRLPKGMGFAFIPRQIRRVAKEFRRH